MVNNKELGKKGRREIEGKERIRGGVIGNLENLRVKYLSILFSCNNSWEYAALANYFLIFKRTSIQSYVGPNLILSRRDETLLFRGLIEKN